MRSSFALLLLACTPPELGSASFADDIQTDRVVVSVASTDEDATLLGFSVKGRNFPVGKYRLFLSDELPSASANPESAARRSAIERFGPQEERERIAGLGILVAGVDLTEAGTVHLYGSARLASELSGATRIYASFVRYETTFGPLSIDAEALQDAPAGCDSKIDPPSYSVLER